MIPINPGNLLPFYTKQAHQRHRQLGQNYTPFGLVAPRTRLMPFQVYCDFGTYESIAWGLRSSVDDSTGITLDSALLDVYIKADFSGLWITWAADQDIDVIPDCGFWYVILLIDGTTYYYSEVLDLRDMCGIENAALTVSDCSVVDGNITFTLNGAVYSQPGYQYQLQKYIAGWVNESTDETYVVTVDLFDETASYGIVVTTVCGLIMTRQYNITWDSGDPDPCSTLEITETASTNNAAGAGFTPTFRLEMDNGSIDKANVLYQHGYTQMLYLPILIFDAPDVIREVEATVNGYGNEVRRFTRTVQRSKFEAPDLPDYALAFLAKMGDLDSVLLINIDTNDSLSLTNMTFESRRQGPALHVGAFTFDGDIESFAGCQTNYLLD